MNRYFAYIIALGALGAAGLLFVLHFKGPRPAPVTPTPIEHAATTSAASATTTTGVRASAARGEPVGAAAPTPEIVEVVGNATLRVDGTDYPITVEDGTSVLTAMQALQAHSRFRFTGRDYLGLGYFVESIDGRPNGGGKYWFLYVNGVSAAAGASQTTLKPGDTVEWRYHERY